MKLVELQVASTLCYTSLQGNKDATGTLLKLVQEAQRVEEQMLAKTSTLVMRASWDEVCTVPALKTRTYLGAWRQECFGLLEWMMRFCDVEMQLCKGNASRVVDLFSHSFRWTMRRAGSVFFSACYTGLRSVCSGMDSVVLLVRDANPFMVRAPDLATVYTELGGYTEVL